MFDTKQPPGAPTLVMGAAELVAALDDARRRANREDARKVHFAYDVLDVRLSAEANRQSEAGDAVSALRTAAVDVAEALKLSHGVAAKMIGVGEQLWHRLPLVNTLFTAGELDYGRVSVISSVLGQACENTVTLIEGDVVAAAQRLTPSPLRDEVWSLWSQVAPDEAQAAKDAAAKDSIGAYRRKRNDGITDVVVTAADRVADELFDRIVALAGTVCPQDPRSRGELRAAAALAMARDQTAVACLCGGGDDCAVAGSVVGAAPVKRITAIIDIELLLGLTSVPPTTADGSPLDPDVARLLATDARWQVILSEMRQLADGVLKERATGGENGCAAVESEAVTPIRPPPAPPSSPPPALLGRPLPEPGVPTRLTSGSGRVLLRRSRWFAPPPLPNGAHRNSSAPRQVGWNRALNEHIARLLEQVTNTPALAAGIHPDGHGGLVCPPPGALTYVPSVEVSALVRAKYRTCTAPGCSRPSAECQLDHMVAFDKSDPLAGGWTITSNLHPLCLVHHQAKTEKHWIPGMLADGFICWRTDTGLVRITAPASGMITFASAAFERDDVDVGPGTWPRRSPHPVPDDLDAPTWWETHHREHDANPEATVRHIATMKSGPDRDVARLLHGRYLEHREIVLLRRQRDPAPF